MRRFLLGTITVLLTLGTIVGLSFFLGKAEKTPVQETLAAEEAMETMGTMGTMETKPQETLVPAESNVAETVPRERQSIGFVPRYYQTDYPHVKFGNGTIATSGCSITCLAMVATYLTDQEYSPLQMAYHFGSFGKTNIERLDYGIRQMQLPYERTENVQDALQALRSGKVVIAMVNSESVFTTQQHFIVWAGRNEAGKFVVNDPLEPNYTNADIHLKNAYENGFEDYHLMQGFSGGWIFDKEDMPEEPFLFDASMPEQQENRYEGYLLADNDKYTLACFVWAEAAEEAPEVQQAVAEVVLNRVVSPEYPNTVRDVIYQTEFYRAAGAMARLGELPPEAYWAVDAAMYGPYILPEDVCFYSAWEKGKEPWGQLGSFTFTKKR